MADRIAVLTPSYAGDFERCRLLCESMDKMATEPIEHLLLVADHDFPLFAPLAGGCRRVITDTEVLPGWLVPVKPPLGRWRWVSRDPRRLVWPMTGWHVQQLRKLLAAHHTDAEALVMADSDSVFVRPLSPAYFVSNGKVRLYAKPAGINASDPVHRPHRQWTNDSARLLGLPQPAFPATDHINNLVSWRRTTVLAMIARIEATTGRDVVSALGRLRTFSEYQLYGAYASMIDDPLNHMPSAEALSHTYWFGDALTPQRLDAFIEDMGPKQIAVCIQSFTQTSVQLLRDRINPIST
jgi:hypothetical protein